MNTPIASFLASTNLPTKAPGNTTEWQCPGEESTRHGKVPVDELLDANMAPPLRPIPKAPRISVCATADDVLEVLNTIIGKDESRAYLMGVAVCPPERQMFATDGHRLARVTLAKLPGVAERLYENHSYNPRNEVNAADSRRKWELIEDVGELDPAQQDSGWRVINTLAVDCADVLKRHGKSESHTALTLTKEDLGNLDEILCGQAKIARWINEPGGHLATSFFGINVSLSYLRDAVRFFRAIQADSVEVWVAKDRAIYWRLRESSSVVEQAEYLLMTLRGDNGEIFADITEEWLHSRRVSELIKEGPCLTQAETLTLAWDNWKDVDTIDLSGHASDVVKALRKAASAIAKRYCIGR